MPPQFSGSGVLPRSPLRRKIVARMPDSDKSHDTVPVRPVLGAWRAAPEPEAPPVQAPLPPPEPEPEPEPEPTREEISRASAAPPRKPGDVPEFVSGPDGRGRRRPRRQGARGESERGRPSRSKGESRESRRQAESRRKRAIVVACTVISLGLLSSFAAGYFWKVWPALRAESKKAEPAAAAQGPRSPEALALVNAAIAARHEGRTDEALESSRKAVEVDPGVPGADILAAEIAFARSDSEGVRRAASRAIDRRARTADAKLLLALDAWMARGKEKRLSNVEIFAVQLMNEAAEIEPSNASVCYFRGELQRTLGRSDDARRSMLGSLYRLQPWASSDILAAKLCLASGEAGQPEASAPAAGQALAALRQALRDGQDPQPALDQLRGSTTSWQRRVLLADMGFAEFSGPRAFTEARSEAVAPVPHGQIPPPDLGIGEPQKSPIF